MKKVMIAAFAMAFAMAAQAASVTWNVSAVAAEKTFSVYLFTAVVDNHYDTFADLVAGSIASGEIVEVAGGRGKPATYRFTKDINTEDAAIAKNGTLYAVIVEGTAANEYKYASFSTNTDKEYVYDTNAQETSPGTLIFATSNMTNTGTIGEVVPEPTSGLLMLLGMAGLALRRRRA